MFDPKNVTPKPKFILRYRDGGDRRCFNYLAFWSGCYDQVEPSEVRKWKRQGVEVKNGD